LTTWAIISAALGAGLAVLLALLWVVARREPGQVGNEALRAMEARLDELAAELREALARAEDEHRLSRAAVEIAKSLELDEVLGRTLEEAMRVADADAATLHLEGSADGEEEPIVASLGLPLTDGGLADRLGVALTGPDGELGSLTVHRLDRGRTFDAQHARRLAELAAAAAPAIANARRFRDARRLAEVDALTGLHNRRHFHETLAREVARAQRYSRRLSLIVFDVDDFKSVNDRIGHLAGDAVLAEAAQRVRSVVRRSDVPCRVGGDEFAVIMPESAQEQAEQLFGRLQAAISAGPIPHVGRLSISAGVAELRNGDDSFSLFERADAALYGAKAGGKGRAAEASA
jgi:diguanylate cyclase (GGDEF)-like protein